MTIEKLPSKIGRAPGREEDVLPALKTEVWPLIQGVVRKLNEIIDGLGGDFSLTVENLGSGEGLLSLDGSNVEGKSLVAGDGISLTSTDDEITLSKSTAVVCTVCWVDRGGGSAAAFYVPFGSETETTSITSTVSRTSFPYDGRLLKVSVISDFDLGSTDIEFHLDENITAEETVSASVGVDTAVDFDFSASENVAFLAGQLLHVRLDPTNVANNVNIVCLWELTLG